MTVKKTKKKQSKTVVQYKKDIALLNKNIIELEQKNIRLLAEFDNYKKRSIVEKENIFKYEGLDFVNSILPLVDDFERILNAKETKNNKPVYEGLDLLYNKLVSNLKENGVVPYVSINEKFDPELHEALMTKESKKKKNVIIEEYVKGYKYHDKVIRHAKVIVSK